MGNEIITVLSFITVLTLNLIFKMILRAKGIKISYIFDLGEGYLTFRQEMKKEKDKSKKTKYELLNFMFLGSIFVFILSIL
jgi:hypothetical protein